MQDGRRHRRRSGHRDAASWRSGRTWSSRSCRGAATTSRTRSSSRERLVKDDVFTSIHIEEFECVARDTKLGKEEITRDIPNVGEEALKDLDESGIVRIGAEVQAGRHPGRQDHAEGRDPAVAGREAAARDLRREGRRRARHARCACRRACRASSSAPRCSARKGTEKDERAKDIEDAEKEKLLTDQRDEMKIISDSYYSKMRKLLVGKTTAARLVDDKGKVLLRQGAASSTNAALDEIPVALLATRSRSSRAAARPRRSSSSCAQRLEDDVHAIESLYRDKIAKLTKGDELPPGVIKMVKVYVAIKRKLSVGDKMAGRHGNKGVVSRILPEEDMPYLEDGTPVDIVLNPLGVPSRMNVGQILETPPRVGGARARQADRRRTSQTQCDRRRCCASKLKKIFTDRAGALEFIDALDDEDVRPLRRQAARAASTWRRRCSTAPRRTRSRAR